MIVPTMTPDEIQREINKDFAFIFVKLMENYKKYQRVSRNVRKFPYNYQVDFRSRITNIPYRMVFTANNNYRLKDPLLLVYTSYAHEGGTTFVCMVSPDPEHPTIELFTPHFLKRYYERMHFEKDYTSDELFQRYWQVNLFSTEMPGLIVDDKERYYHDENTEYFGKVVQDGLIVCERDKRLPSVMIHNTFISPDLFFESQEAPARSAYVCQLWFNFTMNFPRQKEVLNKMFYDWVDEDISVEELHKRVTEFIRDY